VTAEEFKDKFEFGVILNGEYIKSTGDKIFLKGDSWLNRDYVIPLIFGVSQMFSGIQQDGRIYSFAIRCNWQLYQEPTPKFDWNDPEGFWGKDEEIFWFEKQSKHAWVNFYINNDGGAIGCKFAKAEIKRRFTPCPPPPNAEDYFK